MSSGRYLADTHVILWAIADDPQLPARFRDVLSLQATVYASAASVWEMAIKSALGKLTIPDDIHLLLPRMRFEPLDVTLEHAARVASLPANRGDPFDRLIIAQALTENLAVLSVDRTFQHYPVTLV